MTKFISEESDLLREEKQIIWEMFVDWFPYYKKNIKKILSPLGLEEDEKEVFELVFMLGFVLGIFDSMKLLRETKKLKSEIEISDMPSLLQVILNHDMSYNFTEEKTKNTISFLFASTYLGEDEFISIFRKGAIYFTNWGKLKANKVANISLDLEELITNKVWLDSIKPKLKASSFFINGIN